MLRKYELVLVFDTDLDDKAIRAQLDKVSAICSSHSGSVEKEDIWGRRALSYKIGKKEYGSYVVMVITGDAELVADIRRQLKINDAVIRFFITKKDKKAPDLVEYNQDELSAVLAITAERDIEMTLDE